MGTDCLLPARWSGPTMRGDGSTRGRSGSRHCPRSVAPCLPPARAHHARQDRPDTGSAWRGAWDRAHQPGNHRVDGVLSTIRVGALHAARSYAKRLTRVGLKTMLAEAHPPSGPGRRTTVHHRDRSNNSQNRPRADQAPIAPRSILDQEFSLGGDSVKDCTGSPSWPTPRTLLLMWSQREVND